MADPNAYDPNAADDSDAQARLAAMRRAAAADYTNTPASLKVGGGLATPDLAYDPSTFSNYQPSTGLTTNQSGSPLYDPTETVGPKAVPLTPGASTGVNATPGAVLDKGLSQTPTAGTPGGYSAQSPDAASRNSGTDALQRALDSARGGTPTGVPAVTPKDAAEGGSIVGGGNSAQPTPANSGGSIGTVLQPKPTGAVTPTVGTPQPQAGLAQPGSAVSQLDKTAGPGDTGTTAPGTTPGAGTGTTAAPGSLGALTGSITQQLQQMQAGLQAPGSNPDATAVYLKQSQSILDMLNQQEATLRADAEKNGTSIDPATQFTLDKLKQTLEDNLKSTRETLNSRGLYDSGILLELENRLAKGSASDQASILATRLSKLQDQLMQGLTNIGNQRVQTASQFGLAGANAQTAADRQGESLAAQREQQAVQDMLTLRGQQSSEANAAAQREQAASQFGASQSQQSALATQAQNAQASLAAAQRAYEAAQNELNRNATATNQQNAQQAAATLEQMRLAAARATGGTATATGGTQITKPAAVNPYGGSTNTGANVSADLTNAAIAAVPTAANRDAAMTSLANNYQQLVAAGADIQAISDAIDAKFPPSVAETNGNRRVGGAQ